MATTSNNDIAQAIYLVFKDKSYSEQIPLSKKVVEFLFRRRLLPKSKDILLRLDKIINNEEGIVAAKVLSVEKLDSKTKLYIEQSLQKRYSAKKVILNEIIDRNFLGGFRVEVNDEVIDLTVKNKIGKLQEYLISNA
jgi:F-type H+-transporting ATPase subunit delta